MDRESALHHLRLYCDYVQLRNPDHPQDLGDYLFGLVDNIVEDYVHNVVPTIQIHHECAWHGHRILVETTLPDLYVWLTGFDPFFTNRSTTQAHPHPNLYPQGSQPLQPPPPYGPNPVPAQFSFTLSLPQTLSRNLHHLRP